MDRLSRLLSLFPALALVLAALVAAPRAALAQPVTAEVRVVLATPSGAVDAALAELSDRLTRQFPQFTGFRQHAVERVSLAVGVPQSIMLPGDAAATIELRSSAGGTHELRVTIPGGGTTVRTRGGLFFVGGASLSGGTLILAITT